MNELPENSIAKQAEQRVVKSNVLVQKARIKLSLKERRILAILISKIDPFDSEFKPIEIRITDIFKLCNLDPNQGKNYQDVRKAIKGIADKSAWVKIGNRETLLRWIEKPDIDTSRNVIRIRFDEDMKPFLLDLRTNFTAYELDYVIQFSSIYSHSLYEYIQSVHYHPLEEYSFTINWTDLRDIIGAHAYPDYGQFRRRALDPAIEEINRFTEKKLTYTPIKDGKTIVSIRFTINAKNPADVYAIKARMEQDFGWKETPYLNMAKTHPELISSGAEENENRQFYSDLYGGVTTEEG